MEAHPEAGDVDRVTVHDTGRSFDDGTALEGLSGCDGRGDDGGGDDELVAHGGEHRHRSAGGGLQSDPGRPRQPVTRDPYARARQLAPGWRRLCSE